MRLADTPTPEVSDIRLDHAHGRGESQMQPSLGRLFLYSTTISDVGTVRSNNQDSSFAGERLAAVCDGMGGHAGGDTASTIAIKSLAHLEKSVGSGLLPDVPVKDEGAIDGVDVGKAEDARSGSSQVGDTPRAGRDGGVAGRSRVRERSVGGAEQSQESLDIASVASTLEKSVKNAHDSIVATAKYNRSLAGMGTTLSAVVLVDDHWVCAHIGDSRAYMLREGRLRRMTHDHSYVQHLVDSGRISEGEARSHPQRNVVMRVLGDFDIDPEPDISIFKAYPGDRWLLCSDGLCGVLDDTAIEDVLVSIPNQQECARRLVGMALKAGSTDNVTAVIADATAALKLDHQIPVVGGAATSGLDVIAQNVGKQVITAPALGRVSPHPTADDGAGQTDAEADQPVVEAVSEPQDEPSVAIPAAMKDEDKGDLDTSEIPVVKKRNGQYSADPHDPEVAAFIEREKRSVTRGKNRRKMRQRLAKITIVALLVVLAIVGVSGAYQWTFSQYYIGESDGMVAIYQGVNTNLFGMSLSRTVETTDIPVSELSQNMNDKITEGVSEDSLDEARDRIGVIRRDLAKQKKDKEKESTTKRNASDTDSGRGTKS